VGIKPGIKREKRGNGVPPAGLKVAEMPSWGGEKKVATRPPDQENEKKHEGIQSEKGGKTLDKKTITRRNAVYEL